MACLWGTLKWWLFCNRIESNNKIIKAKYIEDSNLPEAEAQEDFIKHIASKVRYNSNSNYYTDYNSDEYVVTKAWHNKERILTWMYLWPMSMLASVFSDLIRELATALYNRMTSVYNRIANAIFAESQADLDAAAAFNLALKKQAEEEAEQKAEGKRARNGY